MHTAIRTLMLVWACVLPCRERLFADDLPVITAENVGRLEKISEFAAALWRIERGPKPRQMIFTYFRNQRFDVVSDADFGIVQSHLKEEPPLNGVLAHDGRIVKWGNSGRNIVLQDPAQNLVLTLDAETEHAGAALSPDGKLIVTGGYGGPVKLWTRDGTLRHTLNPGKDGGLTPVFSPDGKTLAVGNRNDQTRLFDVATGKRLRNLPWRSTQELAFHPDGKSIAVAYVDGDIGLWEVATGKLHRSAESGGKEVYTLDWSSQGDLLVTAGREGPLGVWDAKTLQSAARFDAPQHVMQVRFTTDGTRLLSCTDERDKNDCRVAVWGVRAE